MPNYVLANSAAAFVSTTYPPNAVADDGAFHFVTSTLGRHESSHCE